MADKSSSSEEMEDMELRFQSGRWPTVEYQDPTSDMNSVRLILSRHTLHTLDLAGQVCRYFEYERRRREERLARLHWAERPLAKLTIAAFDHEAAYVRYSGKSLVVQEEELRAKITEANEHNYSSFARVIEDCVEEYHNFESRKGTIRSNVFLQTSLDINTKMHVDWFDDAWNDVATNLRPFSQKAPDPFRQFSIDLRLILARKRNGQV
ncbi:hypothetical protein GGR57DRAFT_502783 [Xylariaceae sp. FL1272]|nr:hypothetical protein GGR57DRAFT_502783 [Xylariaceae sp. FL1272]